MISNLNLLSGEGTLVHNRDETWTFTPSEDWNGDVKFSYNVFDYSNLKLFGNSLYISQDVSTWEEANEASIAMGGNLVTINSEKENEWLTDNGFGGWIGLTDRENEGDWKWLSGEGVNYVNWYPGQPDNVGNEDYVGKGTGNLQWGDANNVGYGNGGADLDAITEIPYYQFGDSIYIELGNSSWEDAQANAEKLGGNLVSINDRGFNHKYYLPGKILRKYF